MSSTLTSPNLTPGLAICLSNTLGLKSLADSAESRKHPTNTIP